MFCELVYQILRIFNRLYVVYVEFEVLVQEEDVVVDEHCYLDVVGVGVIEGQQLLHFVEAELVDVDLPQIDSTPQHAQYQNYYS